MPFAVIIREAKWYHLLWMVQVKAIAYMGVRLFGLFFSPADQDFLPTAIFPTVT